MSNFTPELLFSYTRWVVNREVPHGRASNLVISEYIWTPTEKNTSTSFLVICGIFEKLEIIIQMKGRAYLNSAIALLLGMVNLLTDTFFHAGSEVVVWVGVATV